MVFLVLLLKLVGLDLKIMMCVSLVVWSYYRVYDAHQKSAMKYYESDVIRKLRKTKRLI